MMNRNELEKLYEDQTGLSARRGSARIDQMESVVNEFNLSSIDFHLVDDPDEINYGWQEGRSWHVGKRIGNTVCLGYTNKGSRRDNCVNAIFMVIDGDGLEETI